MTYEDAMKRLAGCRALQPDVMQVIVGAEIVDALLGWDVLHTVKAAREAAAQPLPDGAQSDPANAQR